MFAGMAAQGLGKADARVAMQYDLRSLLHWSMFEMFQMGHPAIPCVHDVYMKINLFQRFCQKPDACAHPMMRKAQHQQQSMAATFFEFVLRSATADVLTLYQNKAETGGGIAARLESLLRAFDEENIHIIGAQETRSEMRGQGFHIFCQYNFGFAPPGGLPDT